MTTSRPAAVIVLAAGEGTRMRSKTPKVLHQICGRSLLGHAIAAAQGTDPGNLVVVVRHERDRVAAHVAQIAPDALVADQDDVPGTGRATECGLDQLATTLEGTVLVTYGDVPLLTSQTLQELLEAHLAGHNVATVMTAKVPDPTGYGRIVRDAKGQVVGIVEHKDATAEQLAITEINSGIYAFDIRFLRSALAKVGQANAQGEKYLTDVVEIARRRGHPVNGFLVSDLWQTEGVNDRVQLASLGAELNRRTLTAWMRSGVTVVDPASTWVDVEVTLGQDSTILPGTQLLGASIVGTGCLIGPDTTLQDTIVGDGASAVRTHATSAVIGVGAHVGPFTALPNGYRVPAGARLDGFATSEGAHRS